MLALPCPPEFPTALHAFGSVAPVNAGSPDASLAKLPIGFPLAVGKDVNAPPPTSRVFPGHTAVASAVLALACGPGVDATTTCVGVVVLLRHIANPDTLSDASF